VLPDGIISNQKSQFGQILQGLAIEDAGIFIAILSILRPNGTHTLWLFGAFCGHFVHFFPVLVCYTEKIWQP
jgi:hypothetical protein